MPKIGNMRPHCGVNRHEAAIFFLYKDFRKYIGEIVPKVQVLRGRGREILIFFVGYVFYIMYDTKYAFFCQLSTIIGL